MTFKIIYKLDCTLCLCTKTLNNSNKYVVLSKGVEV